MRSRRRPVVLAALLLGLAAACGGSLPFPGEEPDAAPPAAPPPAALVLSASGTLTGRVVRIDVQVGQVVVPRAASSGGSTLVTNNPIAR